MFGSDKWIIEQGQNGMIKPFIAENVSYVDNKKILSYGVQPYGYDIRLSKKFLLPPLTHAGIVDVMDITNAHEKVEDDYPIIPPGSYIVGYSIERLKIPKNVTGIIQGKSSLASAGIFVNGTPIDAGFDGILRLNIVNFNSVAIKLHAGEGIAQILFFVSDNEPLRDYADKGGNY